MCLWCVHRREGWIHVDMGGQYVRVDAPLSLCGDLEPFLVHQASPKSPYLLNHLTGLYLFFKTVFYHVAKDSHELVAVHHSQCTRITDMPD